METATKAMRPEIDKSGFTQMGCTAIRDFLSRSEVTSLSETLQKTLPSTVNNNTYSSDYAKAYLSGIDLALKNSSLQAWVTNSPISKLADHLLSTDTVFIRDQFFEKSPELLGTPLHQDAYSLPYYCREVATIWIPLTEVNFSPLVFKLKTHLERVPYPRPNTYDWTEVEEATTYGLQPGDVSIHHGWTVHGSRVDASCQAQEEKVCRKAWAVMYASAKEYASSTSHPHDKWMKTQDNEYLEIVQRTRKEILERKY